MHVPRTKDTYKPQESVVGKTAIAYKAVWMVVVITVVLLQRV